MFYAGVILYEIFIAGKVELRDLLKDLKHAEHLGVLKKQLNIAVKRSKTLEVPLHRSAGEKV